MRVPQGKISDSCRYRTALVCLVFMLGFVTVFLRLFYLQVIRAEDGADQSSRQHFVSVTMEPDRGMIVDRLGLALALNVEVPSVSADPARIENPRRAARKLAKALKLPTRKVESLLKKPKRFVWLKRKVDQKTAAAVAALNLPGVIIKKEPRRYYPHGGMLAHLLGFAGIENQGLEGLEKHYDPYLRGERSLVRLQRDGRARTIFVTGAHGHEPLHGHRLTLTVDEVIQYIAEQELEEGMARTRAKRGLVLVMDPRTGAMLAWALRPTFNPNEFLDQYVSGRLKREAKAMQELWKNRAVTVTYEPGSTIKVFTAAAALESGLYTPGSVVYGGNGQMPFAGTIIHDTAKRGWMTFAEALIHSSNVAMAKIADSLNQEQYYELLKAFGFGERSGIDLPGEYSGLLKPPARWNPRTVASMAMGYELEVTPLQLLTAMAAIANGGWLQQPYVVSAVHDQYGRPVFERVPHVRRSAVSHETADILTDLLVRVVREGTGSQAALRGYTVAGKTGTTQVFDAAIGKYSSKTVIGSFVGFVPAENPRLAMLVILDEPETAKWGGLSAGPVFRRIAERALQHLGVVSQEATIIKTAGIPVRPEPPEVVVH